MGWFEKFLAPQIHRIRHVFGHIRIYIYKQKISKHSLYLRVANVPMIETEGTSQPYNLYRHSIIGQILHQVLLQGINTHVTLFNAILKNIMLIFMNMLLKQNPRQHCIFCHKQEPFLHTIRRIFPFCLYRKLQVTTCSICLWMCLTNYETNPTLIRFS